MMFLWKRKIDIHCLPAMTDFEILATRRPRPGRRFTRRGKWKWYRMLLGSMITARFGTPSARLRAIAYGIAKTARGLVASMVRRNAKGRIREPTS